MIKHGWFVSLMLVGVASAAPAAAPSFSKDVAPLLKARCAICHLTGKEAGNIALHPAAAYDNLVGVKSVVAKSMNRVEPGKPEASYLVAKLDGTHVAQGGSGTRMPFGAPPLPQAQVDLIKEWIKAGAKKD